MELCHFKTHVLYYLVPFYLTISQSYHANSSIVWLWWSGIAAIYSILFIPFHYRPNNVIFRLVSSFAAHKLMVIEIQTPMSGSLATFLKSAASSTFNAFLVHGVVFLLMTEKFNGRCEELTIFQFIMLDIIVIFVSLLVGYLISILYENPMNRLLFKPNEN